jgi:hypothetical protein
MPLFRKKASLQKPPKLARWPLSADQRSSPLRRKLTPEQEEQVRLEEFAEGTLGWDLEDNEELVRYIYQHVLAGGNFVIKKLLNKRAIKSLTSAERTDFPTREKVEEWVSRGDGFGPGTYVVLPVRKNRILARYEVHEW